MLRPRPQQNTPLRSSSRIRKPVDHFVACPAERPPPTRRRRQSEVIQEEDSIINVQDAIIIQEAQEEVVNIPEPLPPLPQPEDPSKVWVAYMDGSWTQATGAEKATAGWGVIIINNGGLPGQTEYEGTMKMELYGKVTVKACKTFLQNSGGKRTNQTAELSGVAETILHFIQELRKHW